MDPTLYSSAERCLGLAYEARYGSVHDGDVAPQHVDPQWMVFVKCDESECVELGELVTSEVTTATADTGDTPPVPLTGYDPLADAVIGRRPHDGLTITVEHDPIGPRGPNQVIRHPMYQPAVMLLSTMLHMPDPSGPVSVQAAAAGGTASTIVLAAALAGDAAAAVDADALAAGIVTAEWRDANNRPWYGVVSAVDGAALTLTPAMPHDDCAPVAGADVTVRVEHLTVTVDADADVGATTVVLAPEFVDHIGPAFLIQHVEEDIGAQRSGGEVAPVIVFNNANGTLTTSPLRYPLAAGDTLRIARRFEARPPEVPRSLEIYTAGSGWYSQGVGVVATGVKLTSAPGDRRIRFEFTVNIAQARRFQGVTPPVLRNPDTAAGEAAHDMGGAMVVTERYRPDRGDTPSAMVGDVVVDYHQFTATVEVARQRATAARLTGARVDRAGKQSLRVEVQYSTIRGELVGDAVAQGRRLLAWAAGWALPGFGVGFAVTAAHMTAEPALTDQDGTWHTAAEVGAASSGALDLSPFMIAVGV